MPEFKGWKSTIPKTRQAISNLKFYIELESFYTKEEKKVLKGFIDDIWKAILEETNDVEKGYIK